MIKTTYKAKRMLKIYHTLLKYRINEIIDTLPIPKKIKSLINFSLLGLKKDQRPRAERLRLALIELGPIYIKFGQIISTRVDLIPEDIAIELAKLQDAVPPIENGEAEKILLEEYGKPLNEVFKNIDLNPLASASIAQVHAATTFEEEDVVVKVLRPNIKEQIKLDISILLTLAQRAERSLEMARMLKLSELVKELEKTILNELDMQIEAGNASQLRRNFANSNLLYVPKVYWDLTSKNVFVMERLHGIPISEIDTMRNHGVDLKVLAEKGVEIFFTQVFRDRFFHADMHPGNIWVDISNPQDPKYLSLDFGIIGTLDIKDQKFLSEVLLAFFNQNYNSIAKSFINTGWVTGKVRADDFEVAIRAVCEPIFAKPLSEISFGKTLFRLFDTARTFNIQMQPQLLLLQKTLVNIEGLGRRLYPQLDLWATGKPLLEQWVKDEMGPSAMAQKIKALAPYWLEKAPELPDLIYESLQDKPTYLPTVKKVSAKINLLPFALTISGLSILVGYNIHHISLDGGLYVALPAALIGALLGLLMQSKKEILSG